MKKYTKVISAVAIIGLLVILLLNVQGVFAKKDLTKIFETENAILYFYSPTCPACKDLQEYEEFNAFVRENNVQKIDVSGVTAEEKSEIIKEYGLKKIPALYFIEDGSIVKMITGKQEILDHILE